MVAVLLLLFNEALKVAVWSATTVPATAGNVAVVLPAAIVMEAGTVSIALLLATDTTEPAPEAGLDRLTVQVVVDPEARVAAAHARLLTDRGGEAISRPLGIIAEKVRI